MQDFNYADLNELAVNVPSRRLRVSPTEDYGDDCSSSLLQKYENTTLALFLISQKIANNGFAEKYCLEDEITEKIRIIRKKIDEKPSLKDDINNILSQYLPISLEVFQILDLGEQLRIIAGIKGEKQGKFPGELEERINQLIDLEYKVKSKVNKQI